MPHSLDERLRASFDPLQGRRLLDQIESVVRPAARHRRIVAVMKLPRRQLYEDRHQQLKGEAK